MGVRRYYPLTGCLASGHSPERPLRESHQARDVEVLQLDRNAERSAVRPLGQHHNVFVNKPLFTADTTWSNER